MLAKAFAKVEVFLATIFFEVFFSKKFFSGQKPEPQALLAPLSASKIRQHPKNRKPHVPLSMLQRVSLSAGRPHLFRKLQLLQDFFWPFSKVFRKTLENRYVTRHIFCYTQKEDENMHNNIYGRKHCLREENTLHYHLLGKMEKQRLLFIKTSIFSLKIHLLFKITAYFFLNEQTDYQ